MKYISPLIFTILFFSKSVIAQMPYDAYTSIQRETVYINNYRAIMPSNYTLEIIKHEINEHDQLIVENKIDSNYFTYLTNASSSNPIFNIDDSRNFEIEFSFKSLSKTYDHYYSFRFGFRDEPYSYDEFKITTPRSIYPDEWYKLSLNRIEDKTAIVRKSEALRWLEPSNFTKLTYRKVNDTVYYFVNETLIHSSKYDRLLSLTGEFILWFPAKSRVLIDLLKVDYLNSEIKNKNQSSGHYTKYFTKTDCEDWNTYIPQSFRDRYQFETTEHFYPCEERQFNKTKATETLSFVDFDEQTRKRNSKYFITIKYSDGVPIKRTEQLFNGEVLYEGSCTKDEKRLIGKVRYNGVMEDCFYGFYTIGSLKNGELEKVWIRMDSLGFSRFYSRLEKLEEYLDETELKGFKKRADFELWRSELEQRKIREEEQEREWIRIDEERNRKIALENTKSKENNEKEFKLLVSQVYSKSMNSNNTNYQNNVDLIDRSIIDNNNSITSIQDQSEEKNQLNNDFLCYNIGEGYLPNNPSKPKIGDTGGYANTSSRVVNYRQKYWPRLKPGGKANNPEDWYIEVWDYVVWENHTVNTDLELKRKQVEQDKLSFFTLQEVLTNEIPEGNNATVFWSKSNAEDFIANKKNLKPNSGQ